MAWRREGGAASRAGLQQTESSQEEWRGPLSRQYEAAGGVGDPKQQRREALELMSVSELREAIRVAGLNATGCLEKADLVQLLLKNPPLQGSRTMVSQGPVEKFLVAQLNIVSMEDLPRRKQHWPTEPLSIWVSLIVAGEEIYLSSAQAELDDTRIKVLKSDPLVWTEIVIPDPAVDTKLRLQVFRKQLLGDAHLVGLCDVALRDFGLNSEGPPRRYILTKKKKGILSTSEKTTGTAMLAVKVCNPTADHLDRIYEHKDSVKLIQTRLEEAKEEARKKFLQEKIR